MPVRIIGPIQTNINAIVGKRQYDVVFGAVEFSNAVQYTLLQGPFSMGIDIANDSGFDIYVGVSVQTDEQNIVISDRKHLIFCPHNDHITLSPASVPALAYVTGEVRSVTVSLYRTNTPVSGTTHIVRTALYLSEPIQPTSPSPIIGLDSIALNTSEYVNGGGLFTLQNATSDVLLTTLAPSLIYRLWVQSISIILYPTPFPGDTTVYASIGNQATEIVRLSSETDKYAALNIFPNLIIRNTGDLRFYGTNINTTNDYNVQLNALCQLLW